MKQSVKEFFNKMNPEEVVSIMTFTGANLLGPVKELFSQKKSSKKSVMDDNLAYFLTQDSSYEQVAYNISLLNGELLEESTEIKRFFSAPANKRLVERGIKSRIVVHLQYKKGTMFADRTSSVMGLYASAHLKDFEFVHNNCYIMEIDHTREIKNIILNTTSQDMINFPSWYIPEVVAKKENKEDAILHV